MKFAVVLGRGLYADELAGFGTHDGPRAEFLEIARRSGADMLSYSSAAARRGPWFKAAFDARPEWGSAYEAFTRIGRYDRLYFTGEDVSLRLAILLSARPVRGKLVTLVHNLTPAKSRILRRIGHKAFAAFVILGDSQRPPLREAGVPDDKIVALRNWIDDRYFTPGDGPVGQAFVACGAENRDYATLRAAAERSGRTVNVFGHGFFGKSGSAGAVGPGPHFVLMPRVPFDELRSAYAAAKAVIVPLNDVAYAAGVTGLVEAYAMGKPVIASNSRGLADYLRHGPGTVVPPGDVEALADAMARIETIDLAAAGAANRKWVVEHCALDRYVDTIVGIMESGRP
jgi:glycosyltransferase involved in cell wall biosynthesis